jgi:hypothetical protein
MRNLIAILLVMLICAGCRTAARMIGEPRADVEMPTGNRGYLIGSPPAWEGPKSTVRKIVEMEIETPTLWAPAKPPASEGTETLSLGEALPPSPQGIADVRQEPSSSPTSDQPRYTK